MSNRTTSKAVTILYALLPLSVMVYLYLIPMSGAILTDSTNLHLNFEPQVTLGYSLFLGLFSPFDHSLLFIITVQVFLYVMGVYLVGLGILKISDSHAFAATSLVLLLINPPILSALFLIDPAALYLSLLIVMLGFYISALNSAAFGNLFGFGTTAGCLAAIFPSGLSFGILLVLALPFYVKKYKCSMAKAFLIPLICFASITVLEAVTFHSLHEKSDYRPSAKFLFANSALMNADLNTPYAEQDPRTFIWERLENDLSEIQSSIWQGDPSETAPNLVQETRRLENTLEASALEETAILLGKTPNDIRIDIALARMIQSPVAYLETAWVRYHYIWSQEGPFSQAIQWISLISFIIFIWLWLGGHPFSPAFALCFAASFILQSHIIIQAFLGLEQYLPIYMLRPISILFLISLLLGFFNIFIRPKHNHAAN
jgi:hypothetical protein